MNEQEKRKVNSEKLLTGLGSGFLPSLPLIETEDETRLRTPKEVGERLLCLLAVCAKADRLETERILEWLNRESLIDKLSHRELTFLRKDNFEERERIQFIWQTSVGFKES